MKTINFREFNLYEGIARRSKKTVDVSESFADIIYRRMAGIRAAELAMRIYRDGEVSVDAEDEQLIIEAAQKFCTPAFIDGVSEQLNGKGE
jgi:hypothetical protein